MAISRICICGTQFETERPDKIHCSKYCKYIAFRRSAEDRSAIIKRYLKELNRELSVRGFNLVPWIPERIKSAAGGPQK
jgi:hypothetical protein